MPTIYIDKVKQNFTKPAFCIEILKTDEKRLLSNRFKITYDILITYLTYDKTYHKNNVIEKLYAVLDTIYIENKGLKAMNVKSVIDENSDVKFYATYSAYLINTKHYEKMEKLIEGGIYE